jgi:hypothetical protein
MSNQGPLILWEGDEPIGADIIFVHGLRGDRVQTWTKDKVFWPKDLLAKELALKNTRIITVGDTSNSSNWLDYAQLLTTIQWGYDSTVAKLNDFSSQISIFGHAGNLLVDIARQRLTTESKTRPIVFVGHSLGGLVIKEVCREGSR